jgi:hypothetical protein
MGEFYSYSHINFDFERARSTRKIIEHCRKNDATQQQCRPTDTHCGCFAFSLHSFGKESKNSFSRWQLKAKVISCNFCRQKFRANKQKKSLIFVFALCSFVWVSEWANEWHCNFSIICRVVIDLSLLLLFSRSSILKN